MCNFRCNVVSEVEAAETGPVVMASMINGVCCAQLHNWMIW